MNLTKSCWDQNQIVFHSGMFATCGTYVPPFRDKQDRHETPSGVQYNEADRRRYEGSLVDTRPLWGNHNVPDTIFESLMVCPPGTTPQQDRDDTNDASMMIEAYMALLNPKERAVIELVVFGGMSLAEAGVWLAREFSRGRPYSKALVAKYRDSALQKLRDKVSSPTVEHRDEEAERGSSVSTQS